MERNTRNRKRYNAPGISYQNICIFPIQSKMIRRFTHPAAAKKSGGTGRRRLLSHGDVPVSTGVRRLEQRVDAPTILKMGNYKLKNDSEPVLAAA